MRLSSEWVAAKVGAGRLVCVGIGIDEWLSYPFTPLPFPSSSAPIHPNQNTWSSQSKHGFSSSCPVSNPAQLSFFSFDLGKDLACYKVRVFFAHARCSFFVFTSGLSSFSIHPTSSAPLSHRSPSQNIRTAIVTHLVVTHCRPRPQLLHW